MRIVANPELLLKTEAIKSLKDKRKKERRRSEESPIKGDNPEVSRVLEHSSEWPAWT